MIRYLVDLRVATRRFPGVGRYAFNLARGLRDCLAADEQLVLLRDPEAASHWDLGALGSDRVELTELAMSPFAPGQHRAVDRIAARHRCDLYHSPHYAGGLSRRVTSVVTVHDLIPLLFPALASRVARVHFRMTLRRVRRLAARLVVTSQRTRADLVTRFGASGAPTSVIPLAADPVFRPLDPDGIARYRARRRLDGGYVLYAGSNRPHKNLVRLIEAWAAIRPQAVPLVVAGPWDRRYPGARRRCAELRLGHAVRFIGPVPEAEMRALYASALLLVHPSVYEGFGLTVLEAMACGTPVTCAGAGSLPEVVGEAALVFDPGETEAIAAALARALADGELRRTLARLGGERARAFSWQRTARATLDVYRDALRR